MTGGTIMMFFSSLRRFRLLIFMLCSAVFFLASPFSAEADEPVAEGNTITFQTDYAEYTIGTDGINKSFRDRRTGKDYLDPDIRTHFMSVNVGRGYVGASKVSYKNRTLFVEFGDTGITARIFVRQNPRYITFDVVSVNKQSARELQLVNLPLTCAGRKSTSLTSTRDDTFAGCVIPLYMKTTSRASENLREQKAASDRSVGISMDEAEAKKETVRSSNSLIAWVRQPGRS